MGYESTLHVVEVYDYESDGVKYAPPIASFDLSKMGAGPFAELLARHPAPSAPGFYFYGTDGNTPIKTDAYGENLRPLPLDEVVEAIQAEIQESERAGAGIYRRLMPAYALLAAFLHNRGQWRQLMVLHEGH